MTLNSPHKVWQGKPNQTDMIADVAAYSSFYRSSDYPISKVLREPVYVEVRLLGRSDPNIVLNLEHCWATSTPNPQSVPQWDLLVDGYESVHVSNWPHANCIYKVCFACMQLSLPWWQVSHHSDSSGWLFWPQVSYSLQTFHQPDVHLCEFWCLHSSESYGTCVCFHG